MDIPTKDFTDMERSKFRALDLSHFGEWFVVKRGQRNLIDEYGLKEG